MYINLSNMLPLHQNNTFPPNSKHLAHQQLNDDFTEIQSGPRLNHPLNNIYPTPSYPKTSGLTSAEQLIVPLENVTIKDPILQIPERLAQYPGLLPVLHDPFKRPLDLSW